ncbi:hypothetical protein LQ327_01095 [Actinomycetospora endophytica]|uniref:Uncharacterized protein n=1 Tax=Actinomycetospora endophytica TaxID=2291215 RepID=A0ABS8P163_9PSEU|nr:hypothetical protein [Actinomycetospora endophytica]MCD2191986.1 hypothetical protein [Actinomycetospora endophytica]
MPGRTELAQHPIPATVIPERPWWPTWIAGDEDGRIRREYAERSATW